MAARRPVAGAHEDAAFERASDFAARPAVVVFGSKVLAGGRPSGSLARRTLGALRWAERRRIRPVFVVSGGLGEHAPAEAVVMRDLLVAHGADPGDIVMEAESPHTLANVVNSARILRRLGTRVVWVCSDDYHVPRCWLLMRMAGFTCRAIFLPGSRAAVGSSRWTRYCAHEAAAILRDVYRLSGRR